VFNKTEKKKKKGRWCSLVLAVSTSIRIPGMLRQENACVYMYVRTPNENSVQLYYIVLDEKLMQADSWKAERNLWH
jgi:hypothetical protein